MRRVLFVAFLLVALQVDKAFAAIQTYAVSGTFDDSGILSGQFSYDGTNFSDISISVSGGSLSSFTYGDGDFFSGNSGSLVLDNTFRVLDLFFSPSLPVSFADLTGDEFVVGEGSRNIESGSVSPVPAPAALALLATALSGLGIGARRARVRRPEGAHVHV